MDIDDEFEQLAALARDPDTHHVLRDPPPDDAGIDAAIDWATEQLAFRHHPPRELIIEFVRERPAPPLPIDAEPATSADDLRLASRVIAAYHSCLGRATTLPELLRLIAAYADAHPQLGPWIRHDVDAHLPAGPRRKRSDDIPSPRAWAQVIAWFDAYDVRWVDGWVFLDELAEQRANYPEHPDFL